MISAPRLQERLLGAASSHSVWEEKSGRVDRRQLHRERERCRAILLGAGVASGDFVAVQATPGVTLFALLLAAWSLDARVILIDHRVAHAERQNLLTLCPPRFLVREQKRAASFTSPTDELLVDSLPGGFAPTRSVCLVQFTSGSTGRPKVVGRSAHSLWDELDRYAAIDGMPAHGDRLLLLSSPVHTWGLIGGILHGLATHVPVLFASAPHGGAIARAARELDATAAFGVSTHFELLADTAQASSIPDLRLAVSAGMVTDPVTAQRFRDRVGCSLGQIYGMTEFGVITADLFGRAPGTVGLPTRGMALRVDDGELYIRAVESPYLVDDGVQRYRAGWLRAFDRAEIDPETGAVTVLGRADSVVTVGGVKIDLLETERVLQAHPQVSTAVVVFGDAIEAHVEVTGDLDESRLAAWMRSRLNPTKQPKRYYLHDDFARTPTGKAIRDREQLLTHFHRRVAERSHQTGGHGNR